MKYGQMNLGGTDGCCGVTQVTGFSNINEYQDWGEFLASGNTAEEIYQKLFDQLMDYDFSDDANEWSCSVLQIWFVKHHDFQKKDNEEYEAAPLMRLVEQIPGVLCLGEFRNVNSGNLIKGYQWAV